MLLLPKTEYLCGEIVWARWPGFRPFGSRGKSSNCCPHGGRRLVNKWGPLNLARNAPPPLPAAPSTRRRLFSNFRGDESTSRGPHLFLTAPDDACSSHLAGQITAGLSCSIALSPNEARKYPIWGYL